MLLVVIRIITAIEAFRVISMLFGCYLVCYSSLFWGCSYFSGQRAWITKACWQYANMHGYAQELNLFWWIGFSLAMLGMMWGWSGCSLGLAWVFFRVAWFTFWAQWQYRTYRTLTNHIVWLTTTRIKTQVIKSRSDPQRGESLPMNVAAMTDHPHLDMAFGTPQHGNSLPIFPDGSASV